MAKKLRDIAGKGKFAGVRNIKVAPPDIDDKNLYQWNSKDGVDFVKKHDTETHEYPYDADAAFKGRKDGGSKTTKYKFQKDGVYEESEEELDEISKGKAISTYRDRKSQADAEYNDGFGSEGQLDNDDYGERSRTKADKTLSRIHKKFGSKIASHAKRAAEIDSDGRPNRRGSSGDYLASKQSVYSKFSKPNSKKGTSQRKNYMSINKGKFATESSCNHTMEGVMCEVHGEAACPTKENDVNTQKKSKKDKEGREYLADKKKHSVEEASQYRSTFGMGSKRGWASSKARKVTFQDPAYLPTGPKKADLRDIAAKATADGKITKLPAGKAKGLKEEDIQEVAPPSPKIEKWIKANKERFVKQYGKEKGTQVLYAKAWKMHGQSESGTATNTDYTGPGAAGWTTGRLDVGTL